MSNFCDRSPCPGMLQALGRWIFGNAQGGYTALTGQLAVEKIRHLDKIEYCPFCGTHLTQLQLVAKKEIQIPVATH